MDDDGYPTEEELEKVRTWDGRDYSGLMEYVQDLWYYPDRFMRREIKDDMGRLKSEWTISTGGWSGNEDLISAMHDNHMFWACCWQQARRGGGYTFHVPIP